MDKENDETMKKAKEKLIEINEISKKLKDKIPKQGSQAKAIRRVTHLLRKKIKKKK